MGRLTAAHPITALIYEDGAEAAQVLRSVADALTAAGVRCCGFVQHDEPRSDRPRCDMYLVDVVSGDRLKISEDRGPHARGCRLDSAELVRALGLVRGALAGGAEVLILNKFGKSESEGQGFRPLIAEAIESEIPVIIGVPSKNIDGWRQFCGELSTDRDVGGLAGLGTGALLQRLGLSVAPAA